MMINKITTSIGRLYYLLKSLNTTIVLVCNNQSKLNKIFRANESDNMFINLWVPGKF